MPLDMLNVWFQIRISAYCMLLKLYLMLILFYELQCQVDGTCMCSVRVRPWINGVYNKAIDSNGNGDMMMICFVGMYCTMTAM